ncbi:uncharacterized protein LOC112500422 [Cynara cardunculus var. scolymus]|uniref:uncharacterized protein LOC112500422 n=1 Tax=Cynara cardunculus var. scolymus TaxID=59895 RepID=UPI000D627D19|nr:uncharacterized protein LOC112500422 [Cynara cardunculus var. scolymus]
MEKLMVEPYDMECMKMALLKHEETFKQQVFELHRLYEIQRMLMKKMQRSMQNIINEETKTNARWNLQNGSVFHQKQLNNDLHKQDHGDDDDDEMEEESEIELTLGPTTRYNRKRKKKKKKKSLYSESSSSLGIFASSSSSTDHETRLITLHNNSGRLLESRSTACI